MKSKYVLFLLIALLLFSCSNEKHLNNDIDTLDENVDEFDDNKILIVTDEWPPYIFEGCAGFLCELVVEAFKAVDIEVTIEFYPWERCLQMVDNNLALGTFPWTFSEKRNEKFFATDSFISSSNALFHKNDLDISGLTAEDIITNSDFTIGVVTAYIYLEKLEAYDIDLDYSTSELGALEKLLNDRVDFAVTELNNTYYLIEKYHPEYIGKIDRIEGFFENLELGLLIGKNYTDAEEYVEQFNIGLRKINDNGTYQKLLDKYNLERGIYE